MIWVVLLAAAWPPVAVLLALLVGAVIRLRDEMEPQAGDDSVVSGS